jgi:hypothetical protein
LVIVVVGELCQWKVFVLFRTIIQNTSTEHVFNDLVHSLSLAMNLRMIY